MSNVHVQFKRGNTNTLNNTPITDGMIYFNIQNNHIYMDNGTTRLEYANDLSNFMNKNTIESLVNKSFSNAQSLMKYSDVNRVIGNFDIGDTSIINAINVLYTAKSLFIPLWSDNTHLPFATKTIILDDVYPYYIIYYGSYEYDEDTETVSWKQDSEYFEDLSNYSIALNDTVFYTSIGEFDSNSIVDDARRVEIISNTSTNKTTFNFGAYGRYINGTLDSSESESNNYKIPFSIVGIKS